MAIRAEFLVNGMAASGLIRAMGGECAHDQTQSSQTVD